MDSCLSWHLLLFVQMHIYIYINIYMAKWAECSPIVRETWVQSQVASYQRFLKWYLIPPCLTLSNIRYISSVKWSNPGKGVAPSPTPRCCSYLKGSLLVFLEYSQLNYFVRPIGIMIRVFTNGVGVWGSIPRRVIQKTGTWYRLDTALLNTQHYKLRIKSKLSNPRKAPSLAPRRCSYWKGNLLIVCPTVGQQLYIYIVIHRQTVLLYHNPSEWVDT